MGRMDSRYAVNHPTFSRIYRLLQGAIERNIGHLRSRQNVRAYGHTLVVGAGTGLDVPQLNPETVGDLVLLEPDPTMRRWLLQNYPGTPVLASPVERIAAEAETFDTVISSLVLCSVFNVDQALREIARVLKPGGQYLFLEHVQHEHAAPRLLQHGLNPVWRRVGGGCRLILDLRRHLMQSPLTVTEYALRRRGLLVPIVAGCAIKSPLHAVGPQDL